MDIRVTNKYCMVIPDEGEVIIDEFYESARIETPHTIEVFDTDEKRVTFIASMGASKFPVIPGVGEWCDEYKVYQYGDDKAKCLQGHTRMHFAPEDTPALLLIIPTITEDYPVWKQPTGAHDAYKIGDIVHYPNAEGQLWRSKINANTTKPDGDVPYNRYWEPYK